MINTTTIPTQLTSISFTCIFGVLSMGVIVGATMMELFLQRMREKQWEEEDSEEEEEEEIVNKYSDSYADAFEALPLRLLTEEELKNLNTKIVREQVAKKVEVILTFDKETDTFWYYTDNLKEVSYDILETVARKFAIDYDCKMICLDPDQLNTAKQVQVQAEVQAEEAQREAEAEVQLEAQVEPVQVEPAKAPSQSVFAKFKKYNTGGKGSAPNFTSVVKVIEQMNHFRYRGKIYQYEESLTAKNKQDAAEPTLDYASYKKLLEKKED